MKTLQEQVSELNSRIAAVLAAKAPAKAVAALPAIVTAFVAYIVGMGGRLSYAAFSAVLVSEGVQKAGPTAARDSGPFCDALPRALQFAVCQKGGSYHPTALAKWGEVAPEGFASRPIVKDAKEAVALLSSFKELEAAKAASEASASPTA